jgi:hypothetical protein
MPASMSRFAITWAGIQSFHWTLAFAGVAPEE